jgi:hypothetical protein
MPLHHIVISLELYQQTYTYDTGNNLTHLLGLVILWRSIVLGSIFNAPAIFVIPKY